MSFSVSAIPRDKKNQSVKYELKIVSPQICQQYVHTGIIPLRKSEIVSHTHFAASELFYRTYIIKIFKNEKFSLKKWKKTFVGHILHVDAFICVLHITPFTLNLRYNK